MSERRSKTYFLITLALATLIIPSYTVGNIEYCDHEDLCGSFFQKFLKQPPNEIGDTLAGVFGSLAFMAAAIAVVMQSFELSAQREELKQSRIEYAKMSSALEAQAEVFRDEQKEREEERNRRLFDAHLESAIVSANQIISFEKPWKVYDVTTDAVDQDLRNTFEFFSSAKDETGDEFIRLIGRCCMISTIKFSGPKRKSLLLSAKKKS